jgi:hypothetical protein
MEDGTVTKLIADTQKYTAKMSPRWMWDLQAICAKECECNVMPEAWHYKDCPACRVWKRVVAKWEKSAHSRETGRKRNKELK